MLLNIENPNSLELSETTSGIQFKSGKWLNQPTAAIQFSLSRKLRSRFYGVYNLTLSLRKINSDYCHCGSFDAYRFEGYSQWLASTHSAVLVFEPIDNLQLGPGVFYQFSKAYYFDFSVIPFSVGENASQAGLATLIRYSLGDTNIEFRYNRTVGNMFFHAVAEKIDTMQISVLLKLYQFKTKKERRKQKGKKYR